MSYDTNRTNISLSQIGVRAPNTAPLVGEFTIHPNLLYNWYMSKPIRMSECHPDIRRYANGLCKKCYLEQYKDRRKIYNKRWRDKNPDKARAIKARYRSNPDKRAAEKDTLQRYRRATRYGISYEYYLSVVEDQKGHCAICGKETQLSVDHNHETGMFRGLLCNRCNSGLGFYEFMVNSNLLGKIQVYLDRDHGL